MYKRILVPIDGSSTSDRALQEAIKLIDAQPALLRLVHVVDDLQFLDTEGYVDYAELRDLTRKIGERALQKAREIAQQADLTVETSLLEANGERIAHVLDTEASSWSADLIVIGTHGRSGFNHLLFGSVAEGVVRGASVPVLLVRSE
ncbi:MAG TPA: universal stress protein [Gallionella sp.]|jgi:nucleotide-binding universal stress UspA family protein|nr:universal stress protein [Gallionella sp.]OGS67157.1 MAG: universal stress protein [Gallionellales bacterium GWA2_54_124]HCI51939.1 universal stress protein [Gallionella sp.]